MCKEKKVEATSTLKEALTSGSVEIDKFRENQPF
jgi:hypothetical protein